jgi:hypothetical protein
MPVQNEIKNIAGMTYIFVLGAVLLKPYIFH